MHTDILGPLLSRCFFLNVFISRGKFQEGRELTCDVIFYFVFLMSRKYYVLD